jgi:organic radical activating enzyme
MKTTDDLIENGNRCAVPWLHAQLNLQNNTIAPCCKYKKLEGPVESFIKIWTDDEFKSLRKNIISNTINHNCEACNVPDTTFSYRSFKNKDFTKYGISVDLNSNSFPKVFNISLKNTCNLACRMCSPYSSSKLGELSKKSIFLKNLYNFTEVNNRFDIDKLKGSFKEVVSITISGGEPLIDSDCLDLINLIKQESTQLRLITFSTNYTKPNKNIIAILNELNCKIQLNLSIDGNKIVNDYIRHGCDLNNIIDNISNNKNFSYGVNSTISLLNVGYIPELITTLEEIMSITGIAFTHIMSSPVLDNILQVSNLPKSVKNIYKEKLKNFKNPSKIEGSQVLIQTALELLEYDTPNWDSAKEFLEQFDIIANTSYKTIYPEFDIL